MLTRVIVAVIAIPVLLAVIFFAPVWAWGIVVGAISACAAWELTHCAQKDIEPRFAIFAAVSAALIPLLQSLGAGLVPTAAIGFLLCLAMFSELMLSLRRQRALPLETVTAVAFAGFVMPLLLGSLVRVGLNENGSVYILLPIVAAFASDSGAYFAGMLFGRHKLSPNVSPNKTIEGSIGGFTAAILLMLAYGLILKLTGFTVNYPVLAIYGFLGSVMCQFGDLSFSAVKRICGIKDYGNIIPGHGGALDRFDGMHFAGPIIELLLLWVPAIK